MTDTTTPQIRIRGLYKIFGDTPERMLDKVRAGMSKPDLLAQENHVLGLEDINVDMEAGRTTVVMGLSGSGKSTLIRHLNRLIDPTAGEILIDGEDIMKLGPTALRDLRRTRMSMVFQKFALLPHRTVLENAAMPLEVRGVAEAERAEEGRKWLDRVGLAGYEDSHPHQLSGGMQQRVGIARALTSNSDIMLMDEAFSALDPLIRTDMQNLLLELQEELHKTIVFITHDLDEALKLADHLVILNEGRVVQQGEPQHILLNPEDAYIEEFVSDINRARVLRVRSVMQKTPPEADLHGDVDADDNLESVIARAGGDVTRHFRVLRRGQVVGQLAMPDVIRALVPRLPGEGRDDAA
ncbi:glycine/betaine ABC transporter (plasmid) [Pacificitalea manganoxidans]|uniref:Quaternary amine transport ATP-binding protein n=1 Tax=Pacificitalea manganoxidans TaxID=1411902 RepID=A0A291M3V6_9RHOB|nr:betaine/proline/choline family ABC transporter ATP-binding protein [Pacificitalea manganoxidans]ATI43612.1 glycine/betaine ABC transporter [Pacificitalea manganoxidans]MBF51781.1 glycine/betaine ABC transporter [Actibacterium sp.]MDR6309949.1 glycine betaine/proline transport system ATP-binding protein [Pacificitalea manganoxidans]OWU67978.1 glycine/betaine ABC transporter [Roseovarius sp. 22II1-1F6A]